MRSTIYGQCLTGTRPNRIDLTDDTALNPPADRSDSPPPGRRLPHDVDGHPLAGLSPRLNPRSRQDPPQEGNT